MKHSAKLFQVFERLHGAEYESSGIGADGTLGAGATFSFSLPAGPAAQTPA